MENINEELELQQDISEAVTDAVDGEQETVKPQRGLLKKAYSLVKKKYVEFADYMRNGRPGLIAISFFLSAYAFGLGFFYYFNVIPMPLCILAGAVSFALEVLLVRLAVYLFFKGKSADIIFVVNIAGALIFGALSIAPKNSNFAIVLMIITALSFDVFGRCFFNVIRKKKYKTGYVLLAISAIWICAFLYFIFVPGIGKDYVGKYSEMAKKAGYAAGIRINRSAYDAETGEYRTMESEELEELLEGFSKSIMPGEYTAKSVSYGPDKNYDIFSRTVNLTTIEKPSKYVSWKLKQEFGRDFTNLPLAGKIWYPEEAFDCPVLFIVHGAHYFRTESHLGYDYLGEYLASHGYVVVSVDENIINMYGRNSTRAVLFLDNIKQVFRWNNTSKHILYGKIDEANVVIAGHSRGGETVSTAYLFNKFRCYPENAEVNFEYNFLIKGIIAIAPTVDQYMPASRSVAINNVNYLIIHGSHDEDVKRAMGEKQYANVSFKGDRDCFKSMIYVYGANHGQFNDEWGLYDTIKPLGYFNNVNNFIGMDDQKEILKIITKNFLDVTLKKDDTYKSLFYDIDSYKDYIPGTLYQQMYEDSSLIVYNNFEDDTDTKTSEVSTAVIEVDNAIRWREGARTVGLDGDKENHVLFVDTAKTGDCVLDIFIPETDLTTGRFTFSIADMTTSGYDDTKFLDYSIVLTNSEGWQITVDNPKKIYPSLKVELSKTDSLAGEYEFKHQMSTVMLDCTNFENYQEFDMSCVKEISIIFHDNNRSFEIDNIGVYYEPVEEIEEWRKEL